MWYYSNKVINNDNNSNNVFMNKWLEGSSLKTPLIFSACCYFTNMYKTNLFYRFVIVKGTQCSTFKAALYSGHANLFDPLQETQCGPNTKFSTDLCACAWTNDFICPPELL